MISREQFDTLTPEPPVDPNQEVPPGPPRFQQGERWPCHPGLSGRVWSCRTGLLETGSHRATSAHCPHSASAVPTDALANKLFGAPEPSTIARSLPTTVPESPNYRNARTPRTPRTPQLKDSSQTSRFYPVVKEGRTLDAKVRLWCWATKSWAHLTDFQGSASLPCLELRKYHIPPLPLLPPALYS